MQLMSVQTDMSWLQYNWLQLALTTISLNWYSHIKTFFQDSM